MRSFNYVRTRFAGGEDFVSDAPDEIARDVARLLASLPPLSRSLDLGALALPDDLGTLIHLRAGAYAGRVAFVHALVLAGQQPASMIRDAERLLLSRYGRDGTESADRVDALCEELRGLELRDAASRVSELFVDADALAELEPGPRFPRRGPFWSRRRRSPLRQLRDRAIATTQALGSQLRATRVPERARSLAADVSRSLSRGNTPWIVATAAWIAGAFLLGIGFARGQTDPPNDPAPAVASTLHEARMATPINWQARQSAPVIRQARQSAPINRQARQSAPVIRQARTEAPPIRQVRIGAPVETADGALPEVSCGPPPVPTASAAHDRVLADALLAAIARLEALEAGAQGDLPAVASAPPRQPPEAGIASPKGSSPSAARSVGRYASVVADSLIVRAGPGTEFPRLGKLPGGTAVRASRGEHDGWTRIGEPVSGWVASQYLSAWAPDGE